MFSKEITLENGEKHTVNIQTSTSLKARIYEKATTMSEDAVPFFLIKAGVVNEEDYDLMLDNLSTEDFLRIFFAWQKFSASEVEQRVTEN